LQKVLPKHTLMIIPLASPLILGVYEGNRLIKRVHSTEQTSQSLLPLVDKLIKEYPIEKIIYTNGPGSYMAIKLSYIILKTVEITKGIPLYSCSAFETNNNQPIKAIGNLYFIKVKEDIITKRFEVALKQSYWLPISLDTIKIEQDNTPDYRLPAV